MTAFSRLPLPHLKQRDGELEILELGVNTHNNHLDLEETWNHHDKYHGIWNTNQDTYFSIFPSELKNTMLSSKRFMSPAHGYPVFGTLINHLLSVVSSCILYLSYKLACRKYARSAPQIKTTL